MYRIPTEGRIDLFYDDESSLALVHCGNRWGLRRAERLFEYFKSGAGRLAEIPIVRVARNRASRMPE